jgi:hypothetical protein
LEFLGLYKKEKRGENQLIKDELALYYMVEASPKKAARVLQFQIFVELHAARSLFVHCGVGWPA